MLKLIKLNPAAILFSLNAVVAMITAWGGHLAPGTAGAVTTVVTGLITIITAASTRPVGLQLIAGSAATVAAAFGTWGLHLSTVQIGSGVTVLSIMLAGVLHLAHVPTTQFNAGTDVFTSERRASAGK